MTGSEENDGNSILELVQNRESLNYLFRSVLLLVLLLLFFFSIVKPFFVYVDLRTVPRRNQSNCSVIETDRSKTQ